MTLAARVIPVLLRRGGSLVKGKKFDSWRSVGHPLQAARIHAARAVDELLYLDIGATPREIIPDLKTVEKLTQDTFIPVTVGGGVRSVSDVSDLLRAGADKVAVCTHASEVIPEASERFGRQAIVGVVDVAKTGVVFGCGKILSVHSPGEWAHKLEMMGAGEILLQNIELDGMMTGYDLDLIKLVAGEVSVPVIASCGCGEYRHMLDAIHAGASAVASGSMFQFTDATPKGAAQYLHDNGIPARL